ncbi:hypothetical protein F-VV10_0322 [Faustovirus]|nr:hypothetical protein F-VV10_0322 [Faustovirus]
MADNINNLLNLVITDIDEMIASLSSDDTDTSTQDSNDTSISDLTDGEDELEKAWGKFLQTAKLAAELDNAGENANIDLTHRKRVMNMAMRHFDSNWLNVMAANTSGFVYLLNNEIVDKTVDIYSNSNINDHIVWFIAHIADIKVDINGSFKDYAMYTQYVQYLINISALFNQTNVIKTIFSAVAIKHPNVIKKIGLYKFKPAFSLHSAINNAVLNHNAMLAEWLTMVSTEEHDGHDISTDTVNMSCLNKSLFSEMSTGDINYHDYIKSNGYYYAIMSNDLQLLDMVSNSIYTNVKKRSLSAFINIMEAINTENVNDINVANLNINTIPTGYSINFPLAYAIAYKYADNDIQGYVLRDANYASMAADDVCVFQCNVYKHLLSALNDIDIGLKYLQSIQNISTDYTSVYVNTLIAIDRRQRYELLAKINDIFKDVALDTLMYISIVLTNRRPIIEYLQRVHCEIKLPKLIRMLAKYAVDEYGRDLLANADGDNVAGAQEYATLFERGFELSKNNFEGEVMDNAVAKIISVDMIATKTYDEIVEFIESRNVDVGKVHYTAAVYFARTDVLAYLFNKARNKAPMYLSLMVELNNDMPREQLIKNKQVIQMLAYYGAPLIPRDINTDLHDAFMY